MEFWLTFLPLIIYILIIFLLVIGIVLGIKTIITMDKVEKVIDNVNEKMESLNSVFHIIDFTTDKIAGITDRMVEVISSFFARLWFKKEKKEEYDGKE
ncbi:MAG: hypothetical protein E7172_03305 [Firmicutes bacterium]|nr:hypothetical protein [Bacillota bacterium]